MFDKDFIIQNGKIKNCSSNIAKMSVLEYLVYQKFFIKKIFNLLKDFKTLKYPLLEIFEYVWLLLVIVLAPISFPIIAYYNIKDAREFVEVYKISKRWFINWVNKIYVLSWQR